MYSIALTVVLAVVFLADWERIAFNFLNVQVIREMFPEVITLAARNTIIYTTLSFIFGLGIALALALMKLSTIRPYRVFAIGYIELFRGLPALITLIFIGFGLPIAFQGFRTPGGRVGAGVLGLSIVAGAYMAETIRAGIEAVPKGQVEAARSLGMSKTRTMFTIVLPQAFQEHHPATHQRIGSPDKGHVTLLRSRDHSDDRGAHQVHARFHDRHPQCHPTDGGSGRLSDHHPPPHVFGETGLVKRSAAARWSAAIQIIDLHKHFGVLEVLKGIDLSVDRG